jgi:SPASM domain peptide maturase of grasp-with-spasm system
MEEIYFKLYATCIPVKGDKESHIYDLDNSTYLPIPNLLLDILEKNDEYIYSMKALKTHYNHQYDDGIDAFFNEFTKKRIGFFTTEPHLYPKLNRDWFTPKIISNAAIEFTGENLYDLTAVLQQLENLGCVAVEFRIKDTNISKLLGILTSFKKSRFQSYTFLIDYSSVEFIEESIKYFSLLRRLSYIHFFQVPLKVSTQIKQKNNVFYTEENLSIYEKKANVSDMKITINRNIFMEASLYNIALNNKVVIDIEGNIKNYFTHKAIYGNVQQDKIVDVVTTKQFQEKWFVNNDKITTCKSCQYRYVCIDTSDIEIVQGDFSKKEKCNFSPFLNEWK